MRGLGLCVRFRWTGKPAYHAPEQQVHEQHRDANPRAEEAELQVDVWDISQIFRAGVIRLPLAVHLLKGSVLALVFEEVKVPEDGQSDRVLERRIYRVLVLGLALGIVSGFQGFKLKATERQKFNIRRYTVNPVRLHLKPENERSHYGVKDCSLLRLGGS